MANLRILSYVMGDNLGVLVDTTATIGSDRAVHWIKPNHQERLPKRWISFDSESRAEWQGETEIQHFRTAAAVRWREDLKTGDHAETAVFNTARELWEWVTEFCHPKQRTAMSAHNLGHDIRVTEALEILPELGWRLEWCNLDRNVSTMTWRSEHGTLVLWDTWTWIPLPLGGVAKTVGLRKLTMPSNGAKRNVWKRYCCRDAEIGYRVIKDLIEYIRSEGLGNWQPTGAGMAYATWRHKFMAHKVLVHADESALGAERSAMHTGRAEAWRHGKLVGTIWTEVDLRNAYVTIASQEDLPTKLKMCLGSVSSSEYRSLRNNYRLPCHCHVRTELPVVPYNTGSRIIWPVGTFSTWLWDCEVDMLRASNASVRITKAYAYTRAPILRDWALFVLSVLRSEEMGPSPVVRTWLKHCSRALIGRISLRVTKWDLYGANPFGSACVTHEVDAETGHSRRLMHIGDRTFAETARCEGRDSLPQVTGWIMARCRTLLWEAMMAAGLDELAHVDTDSLIVSSRGLAALKAAYGAKFASVWQVKGSARSVVVYGPRNYRLGASRKAAGVPRKATEKLPNVFVGERWQGVSAALEAGNSRVVVVEPGRWELTRSDPRRRDGEGAATLAYEVQDSVVTSATASSSVSSGAGSLGSSSTENLTSR